MKKLFLLFVVPTIGFAQNVKLTPATTNTEPGPIVAWLGVSSSNSVPLTPATTNVAPDNIVTWLNTSTNQLTNVPSIGGILTPATTNTSPDPILSWLGTGTNAYTNLNGFIGPIGASNINSGTIDTGRLPTSLLTNGHAAAVTLGSSLTVTGNFSVPTKFVSPTNSPTAGQILTATSTSGSSAWSNSAAGVTTYNALTDVRTNTLANGDVMEWDDVNKVWTNRVPQWSAVDLLSSHNIWTGSNTWNGSNTFSTPIVAEGGITNSNGYVWSFAGDIGVKSILFSDLPGYPANWSASQYISNNGAMAMGGGAFTVTAIGSNFAASYSGGSESSPSAAQFPNGLEGTLTGSATASTHSTNFHGILDNTNLPSAISVTSIAGDGSGLTSLSATQLVGTVPSASLNVASFSDFALSGTNVIISPTNGNIQSWILTNASWATMDEANTNYTETLRLNIYSSNTVVWTSTTLSNTANLGPSNSISVMMFDHSRGTNLWWGYRIR